MAKQYNDLDVRDRAAFYHQLMLTVSGDKVSEEESSETNNCVLVCLSFVFLYQTLYWYFVLLFLCLCVS